MKHRLFFLASFAWLLAGCARLGPLFPAGNTPLPEPSVVFATPTPTRTPRPTPTSAGEPQPPGPQCVPENPAGTIEAESFSDYPEAVLEFLDRGGTVAQLDASLYALGVANQPVSVAPADFNGDGREDVAVSIFDPDSTALPPPGVLLVYLCQQTRYELAFTRLITEPAGGPHLWYWQDLNGDGSAELVFSAATCGAHTCFEDFSIMVWNGHAFENRLEGSTEDLPYPDAQITDLDGDGIYDLEVTGSGVGSVGAGPPRSRTVVWQFDPAGQDWKVGKTVLGASGYRIHLLHDADAAAKSGELEAALVFYTRVVKDTSLDDWENPDRERADLAAYARFKMMVIDLLKGQETEAWQVLSEMEAAYPQGTSQHAFVEMALLYREAFSSSGQAAACTAVRQFAEDNAASVLVPLGSSAFGYANPDYSAEDMCVVPPG